MSTIAQRKKFKHLSFGFITKKNNLTDVQFSFEETNIHQKNTFEKSASAALWGQEKAL